MRSGRESGTRIALLSVPGRFPTVSHDVGRWWDALAAEPGFSLCAVSLNHGWWRLVCAPARDALDALERDETFASVEAYAEAIRTLDDHLGSISDFSVSFGIGPCVPDVNYLHAPALARFAAQDSALSASIAAALDGVEPAEIVFLRIGSEYELLTGMCVARVLRQTQRVGHVCLLDHGYENYSLQPHLDTLERAGIVGDFFDSIIGSKDEIDTAATALARRYAGGEAVRGVLRAADFSDVALHSGPRRQPPVFRTFAPEPVVHVRASERSCYWGRCTFCTQNAKFEDPRPPAKADVRGAVDRVEDFMRMGIGNFLFADEAISPAMLRSLSQELLARKLDVAWACRCKLERTYDDDLVALAARAGCTEILFGLETISPDLLRRMDKFVPGRPRKTLRTCWRVWPGRGSVCMST